VISARVAEIKS